MKLIDLYEARGAALYHYTPIKNFHQIVSSNTLKGSIASVEAASASITGKKTMKVISFTRDQRRTFIPGQRGGKGIGFRVNQEKLYMKFGKALKPIAAKKTNGTDGKVNPDNSPGLQDARDEYMKTGKMDSKWNNSRYNGVNLGDWIKGIHTMADRWESEERLVTDEIKEFKKYITGIVIPDMPGMVKLSDITAAAFALMLYSGALGDNRKPAFALRKKLIDDIEKLKVPLVFGNKDFHISKINKEMGKLFGMKKNDPDAYKKLQDKYVTSHAIKWAKLS